MVRRPGWAVRFAGILCLGLLIPGAPRAAVFGARQGFRESAAAEIVEQWHEIGPLQTQCRGDLGRPNVFVPLEDHVYKRKVRYIVDTFQSQSGKRWFQEDTFLALMRLRGMECNAPSGHAEAFYSRKMVL